MTFGPISRNTPPDGIGAGTHEGCAGALEAKVPEEGDITLAANRPREIRTPVQQAEQLVLSKEASLQLNEVLSRPCILTPKKKSTLPLQELSLSVKELLQRVRALLQNQREAEHYWAFPVTKVILKGGTLTGMLCPELYNEEADIDISFFGDFSKECPSENLLWAQIAVGKVLLALNLSDKRLSEDDKTALCSYWDGGGDPKQAFYNRRYFLQFYNIKCSRYGSDWDRGLSNGIGFDFAGVVDLSIVHRQVGPSCISYLDAAYADITERLDDPKAKIPLEDKHLKKILSCLERREFAVPDGDVVKGPRRLFKLAKEMSRNLRIIDEKAKKAALVEFYASCKKPEGFTRLLVRNEKLHPLSPRAKMLFLIHLYTLVAKEEYKDVFLEELATLLELPPLKEDRVLVIDLWLLSIFNSVPQKNHGWILPLEEHKAISVVLASSEEYLTLFPPQNITTKLIHQLVELKRRPIEKQIQLSQGVLALEYFIREPKRKFQFESRGYIEGWLAHQLRKCCQLFRSVQRLPVQEKEKHRKEIELFFRETAESKDLSDEYYKTLLEAALEIGEWVPREARQLLWEKAESHYRLRVRMVLSSEEIEDGWLETLKRSRPTKGEVEQALSDLFHAARWKQGGADRFFPLFLLLRESYDAKRDYISHTKAYRRYLRDLSPQNKLSLLKFVLRDFEALSLAELSFMRRYFRELIAIKPALYKELCSHKQYERVERFLLSSEQGCKIFEDMLFRLLDRKKVTKQEIFLLKAKLPLLPSLSKEGVQRVQGLLPTLYKKKTIPFTHICTLVTLYSKNARVPIEEIPEFFEYLKSKPIAQLFDAVTTLQNPSISRWFLEQIEGDVGLQKTVLTQWRRTGLSVEEGLKYRNRAGEELIREEDFLVQLAGKNEEWLEEVIEGFLLWHEASEDFGKRRIMERVNALHKLCKNTKKSALVIETFVRVGIQIKEKLFSEEGEGVPKRVFLVYALLDIASKEQLYTRDERVQELLFTYLREVSSLLYAFKKNKNPENVWKRQIAPILERLCALYPKVGENRRTEIILHTLNYALQGAYSYYEWGWHFLHEVEDLVLSDPKHFSQVVVSILLGSINHYNDKEREFIRQKQDAQKELEEVLVMDLSKNRELLQLSEQIQALREVVEQKAQELKKAKADNATQEVSQPLYNFIEEMLAKKTSLQKAREQVENDILLLEELVKDAKKKVAECTKSETLYVEKTVDTLGIWITEGIKEPVDYIKKYSYVFDLLSKFIPQIAKQKNERKEFIEKFLAPFTHALSTSSYTEEALYHFIRMTYLPLVKNLGKERESFFAVALLLQELYELFPQLNKKGSIVGSLGNEMRIIFGKAFVANVDEKEPQKKLLVFLRLHIRTGLFSEEFRELFGHLLAKIEKEESSFITKESLLLLTLCREKEPLAAYQKKLPCEEVRVKEHMCALLALEDKSEEVIDSYTHLLHIFSMRENLDKELKKDFILSSQKESIERKNG